MRQNYRAADHLVGVLGIDSETHGDFNGLVELGVLDLLQQGYGLLQRVGTGFYSAPGLGDVFSCFSHLASSSPTALRCFAGPWWFRLTKFCLRGPGSLARAGGSKTRLHTISYPTTSIPMDRAVPRTLLIAASTEAAFKSGIFCLAMSSTCFAVTLPTLSLFGTPDPLAMPAARFNRIEAGGVFVMKVKERSLYTETTTGMISPSISFWLVLALNCLQNSMILICACPRAGPTGGAGVALPAAICNFTKPVIFFAI